MFTFGKFIMLATFIVACSPFDGNKISRYYSVIHVPPVFAVDDTLHFRYGYGEIHLYKFDNNLWTKIDTNLTSIPTYSFYHHEKIEIAKDTFLTYKDDHVFIKHLGNTIFEDALPHKDMIVENLNINVINGVSIEYMPFLTSQFTWDRKKHIISIATDKTYKKCVGCSNDRDGGEIDTYDEMYKIYYAYIYRDDFNHWQYQLINTVNTAPNNDNFMSSTRIPHHSLDGKANLCFGSYAYAFNKRKKNYCFILEDDNKVYLKDLFGQVYNIEYLRMMDKMYEGILDFPRHNYTFDEHNNMHLFYNTRGQMRNNNFDYFWYGYFEKEDPTTSTRQQKILWK